MDDTVQLKVLIPLLNVNVAEAFQKSIIDDLMQYEISVKDEYKDLNSIAITFIIKGTDNASAIEEILDAYVNEHTRIRYSMLIQWDNINKKYPTSVRINKKGKKVITREQKKILGL